MTTTLDLLLRDLQGAVSVSHLYPKEHPRLVDLMTRVVRHVGVLAKDRDLAIVRLDERLVVDGQPVAGAHAARGLFETLDNCGYQRLVLRAGVSVAELSEFVSAVAAAKKSPTGRAQLRTTDHIRIAALDTKPIEIMNSSVDLPAAHVRHLVGVWDGILDERQFDFEAVEMVVLALARTIERHAGSMVPLAALRSHDEYTVMHITNVAVLAMALAEAVGLPGATVTDIGIAALLHDVGKLRVPSEILNSPGRLTDEQAVIVKRHPDEGARVLLSTPAVPELAPIVAYEHHIQYDGGGYPTVPRTWKLNLASAITTVADVYDALRSDRPYRAGLEREKIHTIMTKEAGTVFDPTLVRAFFELVVPRTTVVNAPQIAA